MRTSPAPVLASCVLGVVVAVELVWPLVEVACGVAVFEAVFVGVVEVVGV